MRQKGNGATSKYRIQLQAVNCKQMQVSPEYKEPET
jgi:hypothetical protein